MKKVASGLLGLVAGVACLLPLPGFAETRDLLKDGPLDGFRKVTMWRGVSEVADVDGKCEFTVNGDGKIFFGTCNSIN